MTYQSVKVSKELSILIAIYRFCDLFCHEKVSLIVATQSTSMVPTSVVGTLPFAPGLLLILFST